MKLTSLLVSLLVAGSSAATTWFECNPTFKAPDVPKPVTRRFNKFGEKIDDLVSEYRQKRYESRKRDPVPYSSKCTTLHPPLDHSNPNGPAIDLFVKCYSSSASSTGVMFFLPGGPGDSSIYLEGVMDPIVRENGKLYDVCALDFRGVFRSGGLYCHSSQSQTPGSEGGCKITPNEAKSCRESLQLSTNLTYYSTTQAAHDLMYAINQYTPTKSKVAIYGVSYGTYLLGRFAQIYPNAADILIFDSVANMAGQYLSSFDKSDYESDYVINEYLKKCKSDAFCRSKMTSDPLAFAIKVMNNVFSNSSTCPDVKKIFETKEGFVSFLNNLITKIETRAFVIGLFYRMNLCRPSDITTIQQISKDQGSGSDPGNCLSDESEVIYDNIASAELFDDKLTRQDMINRGNSLTFNGGVSLSIFDIRSGWLFRTDKEYYNKTLSPSGQVLVLGSDLDPQTSFISTKNFYDNLNVTSNQAYLGVSIGGVHFTIQSASIDQPRCGFDVTNAFIRNPFVQPNFTCLSHTFTDDFEGKVAAKVFKIPNIYDTPETTPTPTPTPSRSSAGWNSPALAMVVASVLFLSYLK